MALDAKGEKDGWYNSECYLKFQIAVISFPYCNGSRSNQRKEITAREPIKVLRENWKKSDLANAKETRAIL